MRLYWAHTQEIECGGRLKMNLNQGEWIELLDAIEDPVFIHDKSYCLKYVNKSYCNLAGLDSQAMLGKPYWKFFPKGNGPLDGCIQAIESETKNACSREETTIGNKTFLSKSFSKRSQDQKTVNAIHILQDITEQKRLSNELNHRNYFLELVIENMPARIFWKGCDLLYLGCNTKFAKDAGFSSPSDLIGKSDYEMAWRSQAEMFRADDTRAIKLDVSKLDYEEESTSPDGKIAWLRTSKLPLLDNDKNITGMLGFYQEITNEKQERDRVALEQKIHIEDLNRALDSIIQVMSKAMELRDPYTAGHQAKVALIACAIGKELGWDENHISGLRMSALVHDIGKIGIPSEILTKPAMLSEYEEKLMQEHAEKGYQLLKGISFPWPIADWVRQHHERTDGLGYPQGLHGEAISIEAKVLGVADTLEAMSAHRPYRPALGLPAALAEIKAQSGIKFDPDVVRTALSLFEGKENLDMFYA